MPKKPKKPNRPYTHKDITVKEEMRWREPVKRRAIEQGVTEDEVIRFGLHYDFKKARAEEEDRNERKETLSTLKDILKELKKP